MNAPPLPRERVLTAPLVLPQRSRTVLEMKNRFRKAVKRAIITMLVLVLQWGLIAGSAMLWQRHILPYPAFIATICVVGWAGLVVIAYYSSSNDQ